MKTRTAYRAALVLILLSLVLAPWRSAQAQFGNQWQISYWPNINFQGFSPFTQFSSLFSFDWGFERSPGPGIPNVNWSARGTTSAFFNAGIYRFTIQADDDVRLFLDGALWLDTVGRGRSGKTQVVDIPLVQGVHHIRVDFIQYTGAAYIFTNWQLLQATGVWVPPAPGPQPPVPSDPSVVTDFGDFTPCIQQGIHQKYCFVSNGAWDAPNYGSIEMEPPILVWRRCVADTVQSMQIYQNTAPQSATCSRTQAGWFPR